MLPIRWITSLFARFSFVWVAKWSVPSEPLALQAMKKEWAKALFGIDFNAIKFAVDHAIKNLDFPPSIAELLKLCDQAAGIPDETKAFGLAIRREFTHPIVLLAYNCVGSWPFSNDPEKDLKIKFKEAYKHSLAEFRLNPKDCWEELETDKQSRIALPVHELPKTLSAAEKLSWRERFAMYEKQAAEDRSKGTKLDIPTQDSGKRDEYLIRLSDRDAMNLDHQAAYQRIRLLRQREGMLKCS